MPTEPPDGGAEAAARDGAAGGEAAWGDAAVGDAAVGEAARGEAARGAAAGREAAVARGVGHRFDGTTALAGVDLALARGALTALVGANGSGKTTLLRILAGILDPSAGEVEVLGVPRPARCGRRIRRALRRRASYVSQDPALDPEMTGGEILALVAALHGVGRRERRRRVAELADGFGVASHLSRRVSTWSGGLRRRLHLAAGMIHDPELLLLDEPTAGLDPEGCRLLWEDLAARAARGRAVAVVTHDLAAAERHAATVSIVDRGALVACGSPRELRAQVGFTEAGGVAASNAKPEGATAGDAEPRGAASGAQPGGAVVDLADVFRRLTGRDESDLLPRTRGER